MKLGKAVEHLNCFFISCFGLILQVEFSKWRRKGLCNVKLSFAFS